MVAVAVVVVVVAVVAVVDEKLHKWRLLLGKVMLLDDVSVINHNCRVASCWYFQQPV